MRPKYITQEDIDRWTSYMKSDPNITNDLLNNKDFCEFYYSAMYLDEQLVILECPDELIVRIRNSAAKNSIDKDSWKIHIKILKDYKNSKLLIEDDSSITLN